MMIPSFTLKRATELRPRIQEIVDELLDAMIVQGPPVDLVRAFALPVPSMVICSPARRALRRPRVLRRAVEAAAAGLTAEETQDARDRLAAYLEELIDHKQRQPGEGLLDELVQQRLREGELDREELTALAMILLVAGHETTANMISLGTYTLLLHPDRLAELRADPSLLPDAIEELMRMLSIADGLLRLATEDIEIAGTTIRRGGVVFSTSVINRDEDVYPAPDTLDFHRSTRHHVAFGFGIHQCLGQNLARTELEIALRTLLERLPGLRLAAPPEEIPFKPGNTAWGCWNSPVAGKRLPSCTSRSTRTAASAPDSAP
ncbi:cytochrome P450 [Streptomyces hirsutus]